MIQSFAEECPRWSLPRTRTQAKSPIMRCFQEFRKREQGPCVRHGPGKERCSSENRASPPSLNGNKRQNRLRRGLDSINWLSCYRRLWSQAKSVASCAVAKLRLEPLVDSLVMYSPSGNRIIEYFRVSSADDWRRLKLAANQSDDTRGAVGKCRAVTCSRDFAPARDFSSRRLLPSRRSTWGARPSQGESFIALLIA